MQNLLFGRSRLIALLLGECYKGSANVVPNGLIDEWNQLRFPYLLYFSQFRRELKQIGFCEVIAGGHSYAKASLSWGLLVDFIVGYFSLVSPDGRGHVISSASNCSHSLTVGCR